MATSSDTAKKGTLTIAGSGIASIGHITLETLSYIKESDRIYYLLTDPATEAYIIDNAKAPCVSLRGLYGPDKHRYDTYVQMSEVMLRDVRAGYDVLGIFYGHPGVFVSPTHRAIAIALDEGFKARILPGVSAEDYLFADLRVDPCTFGCAAYEATELLYRGRRLDPTMHNIVWQGNKFELLVDRLEEDFGPNHQVVHYVGAVLPQATTVAQPYTISDLRKAEVASKITVSSTFYIPPRDELGRAGSAAGSLGLGDPISQIIGKRYPPLVWSVSGFETSPAYGSYEQRVIEELRPDGRIPEPDMVLCASEPMKRFMADLALNPKLRDSYRSNPQVVVDAAEGLTDIEKFALKLLRVPAAIRIMSADQPTAALGLDPTESELEGAEDVDMLQLGAVVVG